jgi:hypothetical protein
MGRQPTRTLAVLGALLGLAACTGAPAARQAAGGTGAPTATPDPARPLPSPVPEVVARVNGQPILIRQILPIAKATLDKWKGPEREQHKPEALRSALQRYIDRELLLQEAIERGIVADTRQVEWSYDQMRREHPDDREWQAFLLEQGLDPQSLKAELRAQHTVAALLAEESKSYPVPEQDARALYDSNPMAFAPEGAATPPGFDAVRPRIEATVRQSKIDEVQAGLLARLRAQARIELFL